MAVVTAVIVIILAAASSSTTAISSTSSSSSSSSTSPTSSATEIFVQWQERSRLAVPQRPHAYIISCWNGRMFKFYTQLGRDIISWGLPVAHPARDAIWRTTSLCCVTSSNFSSFTIAASGNSPCCDMDLRSSSNWIVCLKTSSCC